MIGFKNSVKKGSAGMENTLLKDLKNRYSIYNMVIFLLGIGLLVVIYGLKISEIIIRKDYQWEVREGVVFWLAQRFANGVNPYVFHEGVPEPVYMYGFLLPILLSVVIKLAGISKAIIIAQIITILVEICGVVLFGRILKRSGVSFSLIPIGMLCLVSCYFRYGAYSGVFPDAYGITMLLLIWYILQSDELNARLRPFLYALLCVIIFYIKQYFVFITLGFVIYFVMKRAYKELAQFIIFGSVVGGGLLF